MRHIGIVGSGPMAIYLLKHLADSSEPLAISIFEASETAGVGMPYDPDLNADYMLCNAFSREIPTLDRPLLHWLKDRPARELSEWELSAHDLTARAFYPRVLIGEYLRSQFGELCEKAREGGHRIRVHTSSRVTDIRAEAGAKVFAHVDNGRDSQAAAFDTIVIASGHSWPATPEIDGVKLVSPWPYTNITDLEANRIGILGSSLSAIDIVVAIAHARGRFDESQDRVSWVPNDQDGLLYITMVSHMGIMPEGDFYYPFPYEPLSEITEEAIDSEIAEGAEGLLDRVFALLCDELDAADPDYLNGLPPSARSVEGFAPAYFSRRQELGGLRAVKRDLARARETLNDKETIPHRYALLRGHEAFDRALRHLSEADYERFREHLMPVFGDCYAAVPHLSLARIVALYDAGVLALAATQEGATFMQSDDGEIEIKTEDGNLTFETMVDARGQNAASLEDLPFPELVKIAQDTDQPLLEPFQLTFSNECTGEVFCLSLPQLLERHPFSQGLVECSRHARTVADKLLAAP